MGLRERVREFAPLTICALPTAGKAVLSALLEGHDKIFSTPLWHDNITAALCSWPKYLAEVDVNLADGIYGSDLRLKYLRRLLTVDSEWWRLEMVSRQGYYIFHRNANDLRRMPVNFDFYAMDRELADTVCGMKLPPSAGELFSCIFSACSNNLDDETAVQDYSYAVSMAGNTFTDYESLLKTFWNGKVIYIHRDPFDAIGSTIYRTSQLLGRKFIDCATREIWRNRELVQEMLVRKEHVLCLQNKYPERILSIDFYDLIMNTESTMRAVCNFLNIKFNSVLLKATFKDEIIDQNAIGKVRDNMRYILSEDEISHVNNCFDTVKKFYEFTVNNTKIDLSGFIFYSKYYNVESSKLIINNINHDENIFYGPYFEFNPGIYTIKFHFTTELMTKNYKFTIDCIDDELTNYFTKYVKYNELSKIKQFTITLTTKRKIEFRLFSQCHIDHCVINFHGISLSYKQPTKPRRFISNLLRNFIRNIH